LKQLYLSLACLLLSAAFALGEGGPRAKSLKVASQGSVQIQFSNRIATVSAKDSVLIIFDRFDHTGAGVIYQIFHADQDNMITLSEVPAGKYYVTIQCLGLHRDRIEKVMTIRSQKNEKVRISLQVAEEYTKGTIQIPESPTDLADLAILRTR
jgi:hypothetical protein